MERSPLERPPKPLLVAVRLTRSRLGEQRLDLRQLPGEVAARVAGAEEPEDVVALLLEQRGGQAERRVVARL